MGNKKKIAHLVLVRHGESEWNEKGLWTGWQDVSLTEKGRHEARLAARAISDIQFDILVTSDLKRAYETLEIIVQELEIRHLPTIRHEVYKERHYGIYTGKSKWEIKREVGEDKFNKIRRGWNEVIPNGETLEEVFNRVIPHFLENIIPKLSSGQNILIVAHGNTHRAIIKHLEKLSHEEITKVEMATGEVLVYKIDSSGKILAKEKRLTNQNKGIQ